MTRTLLFGSEIWGAGYPIIQNVLICVPIRKWK